MRIAPISVVAFLAAAGAVSADIAFDNFGPGNTFTTSGWLVRGPLQTSAWTHAFPFTAQAGGDITIVTVPIRHLGGENSFGLDLYSDAGGTPGTLIGTIGQLSGIASSAAPPVEVIASPGITLTAGTTYWLYGYGFNDANGTWYQNPTTTGGVRAYSLNSAQSWTIASVSGTSGIGAFRVEVQGGTGGGCYPNCDLSTTPPILNVADFTCFLQRFAAGDSYANCDSSTVPPVLNVADFTCFLQAFAAGCP